MRDNIDLLCREFDQATAFANELFNTQERLELACESFKALGSEQATPELTTLFFTHFVNLPQEISVEVNAKSLERHYSCDQAERFAFALESGEGILDKLKKLITYVIEFISGIVKRIKNFVTGASSKNKEPITKSDMDKLADYYRNGFIIKPTQDYSCVAVGGEVNSHIAYMHHYAVLDALRNLGSITKHIFPNLRNDAVWKLLNEAVGGDISDTEKYIKDLKIEEEFDFYEWLKSKDVVLVPDCDQGGVRLKYNDGDVELIKEPPNHVDYPQFNAKIASSIDFGYARKELLRRIEEITKLLDDAHGEMEKLHKGTSSVKFPTPEYLQIVRKRVQYYMKISNLISSHAIRHAMECVKVFDHMEKQCIQQRDAYNQTVTDPSAKERNRL